MDAVRLLGSLLGNGALSNSNKLAAVALEICLAVFWVAADKLPVAEHSVACLDQFWVEVKLQKYLKSSMLKQISKPKSLSVE